ncbi:MAG: hypothetical protein Q7Q71_00170 [Verrucomicrobiota bacterium JB023]|nr:hypothetical protein [Verrucomicrobiota bacterium JB023]
MKKIQNLLKAFAQAYFRVPFGCALAAEFILQNGRPSPAEEVAPPLAGTTQKC